jgi:L-threonylcarbamoyladenylate synthase
MTICRTTPKTLLEASNQLRAGGVVSFPTETVYGLGCDTFNQEAVSAVYALKSRPKNNPMIAHVLDISWVNKLCTGWDDKCEQLAQQFWPGPLAIVLPKKENVPLAACGGFNTIAIRCPNHPVALKLLELFEAPISAPSANKYGHISPTKAQHVEEEFDGLVTVLDGGPCEKGIESTVISMVNTPTILRLGSIGIEEITSVVKDTEILTSSLQTNSPGTAMRHYAPNTPTKLLHKKDIGDMCDKKSVVIVIESMPHKAKHTIKMPNDAGDYAKKLYASLREADSVGATQIIIEKPTCAPGWEAVLDRLQRCCAE